MTAEERIFSIVRGGLYAKLPSLALPLGSLTCREGDVDPAGTDGEAAVFAPGLLRREFLAESDLPERLTLHLLLHLMLGHPWGRQGRARALWDTACDLAVGLVRHALLPQEPEAPAAFSARCKLQARRAVRAPAIYALLLEQPDALTAEEQAAFYLDDHRLWQLSASASEPKTADGGAETGWQALGRKLPDPLPPKPVIGSGSGNAAFAVRPDARQPGLCGAAARMLRDAGKPPCLRRRIPVRVVSLRSGALRRHAAHRAAGILGGTPPA